jgi:hypothetical protein
VNPKKRREKTKDQKEENMFIHIVTWKLKENAGDRQKKKYPINFGKNQHLNRRSFPR